MDDVTPVVNHLLWVFNVSLMASSKPFHTPWFNALD